MVRNFSKWACEVSVLHSVASYSGHSKLSVKVFSVLTSSSSHRTSEFVRALLFRLFSRTELVFCVLYAITAFAIQHLSPCWSRETESCRKCLSYTLHQSYLPGVNWEWQIYTELLWYLYWMWESQPTRLGPRLAAKCKTSLPSIYKERENNFTRWSFHSDHKVRLTLYAGCI